MLPCIFATPVVTVNIGDLIKPVAAQQKSTPTIRWRALLLILPY
ncbi:hypothetical protein NAB2_0743 [Lactiplantibacillus plantarum]|uniref:Uncharacterized protein n=1 Tax=Lactiplantibacillus plantarum TaxID=1590 RepID=A0AAW3RID9_LACPN|nr:hypothetical protein NAB2_0743 [Lactiplantibacillus plantarum]